MLMAKREIVYVFRGYGFQHQDSHFKILHITGALGLL